MADEAKSGLEELAKGTTVENGAGSERKDGVGQPGTGSSQPSKGAWITVLPEDLRKGVKAEDYGSLNEYVRDLQSKVDGSARDEKAFTEGWDAYIEEMRSSGEALPEKIRDLLKESKVDAEVAKKLQAAISDYGKENEGKEREARLSEMQEFIGSEWKGRFEANNEILKKGLRIFGKAHPELARTANDRGSVFTPEFAQLLVDYAEAYSALHKEEISPEGGNTPKEDASNPYGLKNI